MSNNASLHPDLPTIHASPGYHLPPAHPPPSHAKNPQTALAAADRSTRPSSGPPDLIHEAVKEAGWGCCWPDVGIIFLTRKQSSLWHGGPVPLKAVEAHTEFPSCEEWRVSDSTETCLACKNQTYVWVEKHWMLSTKSRGNRGVEETWTIFKSCNKLFMLDRGCVWCSYSM